MNKKLTHLNEKGESSMVDVSSKSETARRAVASGFIEMNADTIAKIIDEAVPKGDVLATARIAGITAAKKTGELIPLCHPLSIEHCSVNFNVGPDRIEIISEVKSTGKTGIEMEAIIAVSIAAVTIYDMCKAVDKNMKISGIRLIEKEGGRSGHYRADG